MKKIVAIFTVLLLPLLASAYELEPEYADFAKELTETIQPTVANANNSNQEASRWDKIQKVKNILDAAKHQFQSSSWGASGGTSGAGSSATIFDLFDREHYYNVEEITSNLRAEGLDTFLKNDQDAMDTVADYTTDHYYYIFHNDFEALLALGVNPIEAALRTGHNSYVDSALKNGTITYKHYYLSSSSGYMSGSTTAVIADITIDVTTTQEEVNAIKEKLKKNEQAKEHSEEVRRTSYWKQVGEGFESFVNDK